MRGEAYPAVAGCSIDKADHVDSERQIKVSLLTGADDLSYALGLTEALAERGVALDFIGSDAVYSPVLEMLPQVRFLNLRGDQSQSAPALQKVVRILRYYLRLVVYTVRSRSPVFHILWNNKFQHFDRTLLMLWYRLFGHRVVLTAHNVNAAQRDGRDSALNRLTLRMQYHLSDQIFVHTNRMANDLHADFGVPRARITIVPFGINKAFPDTEMTSAQARSRLGISPVERVMLFFGQIAPYKGLEYLVEALPILVKCDPRIRLAIAGKVKNGSEGYWESLKMVLEASSMRERVLSHVQFIPDAEVEIYFKAADVLVMPYVHIFQSGVPFLGFGYGLPVVATDVGALRDDIEEGFSGYLCRPRDAGDLAAAVRRYFDSDIYRHLPIFRERIRNWASESHSWRVVAETTEDVYRRLHSGGEFVGNLYEPRRHGPSD